MRNDLRSYVIVDLDAITANIKAVKACIAPDVKVMAVIKTDGYGHGAVEIGRYLQDEVDYYAAATVEEAIRLRQAGLNLPILILGYTMRSQYEKLIDYAIEQTIYRLEDAQLLSEIAVAKGTQAQIHIALDTGMGRIGFLPDEQSADVVKEISCLPGIQIKGMFTHFSTADELDKDYSYLQMERYDTFVQLLNEREIEIPIKHVCNSAAIMEFDHHRFQMVRSGIVTYGLYPSDEVEKSTLDLKPALEWKAHVVHVKTVGPGLGVSYGKTFVTSEPETTIATINIGYGDGYPRALSNKGRVLIHGKSAPIIGRICMDQFMVDVTGIENVQVEDEVTLIGRDGEEQITVEEAAALAGTFNYEFVCDIGKRIPRLYKGEHFKETKKPNPVVFAVSGYKNSGKTTLTVKLIERLTKMGYRVATIKHDGHDFDPDVPGTDSYRHRKAGAYGSVVFSENRWMMTKEQACENGVKQGEKAKKLTEREFMQAFPEADVILLEGFKHSNWPKYFCRYPEEIPDVEKALSMILEMLRVGQ